MCVSGDAKPQGLLAASSFPASRCSNTSHLAATSWCIGGARTRCLHHDAALSIRMFCTQSEQLKAVELRKGAAPSWT